MRVRYPLLVLLGVAMGQAGRASWPLGSAIDREASALIIAYGPLYADKRLDLRPDATMDAAARLARRAELLSLRAACLAHEDRCRKALTTYPDSVAYQYMLLQARSLTDRAANLVLWHDLAADGRQTVPTASYEPWDLEAAMMDCRRRITAAGGDAGLEDPAGLLNVIGIARALDRAMDIAW